MFLPNRPWLTIGEIAEHWSREENPHTSEEIEQELRGAIFRREFEVDKLGWALDKMWKKLDPSEHSLGNPPADLYLEHGMFQSPAAEHAWEDEGGALLAAIVEERRVRPPKSNALPDFEPMAAAPGIDYRSEICQQILDCTGRFDPARELFMSNEDATYGSFEEADASDISDDAHIVLRHIAIMKNALARWCGDRGIAPPEFLGESTSSNAETQTEPTPQSDAANPDTPDESEPTSDDPRSRTGAEASRSVLKSDTKEKYAKRVEDVRNETGRLPTIEADNAWRRGEGLTRDVMRGLRRPYRSPKEKEGGRPPQS